MKLIVHGAAKEVGRSCIELVSKETRILLDAGLKLTTKGYSEYPEKIENIDKINGVLLCHAHLDHCGALPLFDHKGMRCPIYATPATKALTQLILEDAFKVGKITHQELGYFHEDIEKALFCIRNIKKKNVGEIKDIKFEFFDAGHIPGSASALVNAEGKKVLYTSDIKTTETRLHEPADTSYAGPKGEDIDAMICEATYGDREHPPRKKTEEDFVQEIKKTIDGSGSVLIPVFGIGRAQEILLVLKDRLKTNVPIYVDGMAAEATRIILRFPNSIRDPMALARAFGSAKPVKGNDGRIKICKKQGIFITTSGMLTGGPVIQYIKLLNNEKNSILLTGYQGEETNGRMLEETGIVYLDGWKTTVKCGWKKFDFSAHAGLDDLKKLIRTVNPKTVVFNHGEPDSIKNLAEWAAALGFKTYQPDIGTIIPL